jgi:NADH-quinone oxidoreductase subunit M
VAIPILLAIPLLGSFVVFSMRPAQALLAKFVAFGVSIAVLVYTAVLGFRFDSKGARFQFQGSWTWIKSFGVHFAFGMDGIALVLVVMATILVPVTILASWNAFDSRSGAEDDTAPRRSVPAFFGLVLLLEFFMIGVFTATDIFLFYVFFEVMLVPVYFIIGSFGGPRRQYAAMKFFLYSFVGGLLMLASVIGLYIHSGKSTFAFTDLIGTVPNDTTQKWLFLGFFIAFAVKAPLVPFHTWLPDAGAEAPIGGAVLLVGVLDKVGTFGFLRYCLPLFPDASRWFAPVVLVLAVIGVLYAALLAMGQSDMKRLVSYTSISHFGFIALGIFAFTPEAGTGAVLYMVNHGISTALLFLVVGMLIARGGSRQVRDYGGVARYAPLLAGSFLVAGLATLSLPGTNSFASEFLVLIGAFPVQPVYTVLATVGIILAALYVLLWYQRTMHGPPAGVLLEGDPVPEEAIDAIPEPGGAAAPPGGGAGGATATLTAPAAAPATGRAPRLRIRDLSRREIAVVSPLIAIIIVTGVYPQPLVDLIRPAVGATMSDVGANPAGITPAHATTSPGGK